MPPFPGAGGSYLLDAKKWEWVLRNEEEAAPDVVAAPDAPLQPED
ncbi:MAG: hypothetical protein WCF98_08855 [Synechococcus sp. ELA057]